MKLLFWLLKYVLLVAPSEAANIRQRHEDSHGELARLSIGTITLVESIIRVGALVSLFTLVEISIGDARYEALHLDLMGTIVCVSGLLRIVIDAAFAAKKQESFETIKHAFSSTFTAITVSALVPIFAFGLIEIRAINVEISYIALVYAVVAIALSLMLWFRQKKLRA